MLPGSTISDAPDAQCGRTTLTGVAVVVVHSRHRVEFLLLLQAGQDAHCEQAADKRTRRPSCSPAVCRGSRAVLRADDSVIVVLSVA